MSLMLPKLKVNSGIDDWENWGEGDFSPPKDAVDLMGFNDFLLKGTYPLPEKQVLELNPCLNSPPKDFFLLEGTPTAKVKEKTSKNDQLEADRFSVVSVATCSQTAATTCPNSTYGSDSSSNLKKRNSKTEGLEKWNRKYTNIEESSMWTVNKCPQEKDLFLNSVFGKDLANDRIAELAIRIIDGIAPIHGQEWSLLSNEDRVTLATYLAQVFGQKPQSVPDLATPQLLNSLLWTRPIGRRNEERLNKTVKRVNAMMARSFADINKIADRGDDAVALALQHAYFGEQSKLDVFGCGSVFSQKSFGEAVKNARYAEDFEAILNKSYVGELLLVRQQKILKDVKSLRKLLQEGQDPIAQIDHKNKRSPWLLEDIVEGAKLCQNIIDKRKNG